MTDFSIGDEVLGWGRGTFAEYAVAKQTGLVRKPEKLDFEEAAAIPMAGMVAVRAAWRTF